MIIRQICSIAIFHILHFGKCLFIQVCCTKNGHKTTSKLFQIWKLIWLQAFIKLNQITFFIFIFQSVICLEINNFHLKLSWKIFSIAVKWIMKEPDFICFGIKVNKSLLKLFFSNLKLFHLQMRKDIQLYFLHEIFDMENEQNS